MIMLLTPRWFVLLAKSDRLFPTTALWPIVMGRKHSRQQPWPPFAHGMRAWCVPLQNPKSEIRNAKSETNAKLE
jgi:hypothetical protein